MIMDTHHSHPHSTTSSTSHQPLLSLPGVASRPASVIADLPDDRMSLASHHSHSRRPSPICPPSLLTSMEAAPRAIPIRGAAVSAARGAHRSGSSMSPTIIAPTSRIEHYFPSQGIKALSVMQHYPGGKQPTSQQSSPSLLLTQQQQHCDAVPRALSQRGALNVPATSSLSKLDGDRFVTRSPSPNIVTTSPIPPALSHGGRSGRASHIAGENDISGNVVVDPPSLRRSPHLTTLPTSQSSDANRTALSLPRVGGRAVSVPSRVTSLLAPVVDRDRRSQPVGAKPPGGWTRLPSPSSINRTFFAAAPGGGKASSMHPAHSPSPSIIAQAEEGQRRSSNGPRDVSSPPPAAAVLVSFSKPCGPCTTSVPQLQGVPVEPPHGISSPDAYPPSCACYPEPSPVLPVVATLTTTCTTCGATTAHLSECRQKTDHREAASQCPTPLSRSAMMMRNSAKPSVTDPRGRGPSDGDDDRPLLLRLDVSNMLSPMTPAPPPPTPRSPGDDDVAPSWAVAPIDYRTRGEEDDDDEIPIAGESFDVAASPSTTVNASVWAPVLPRASRCDCKARMPTTGDETVCRKSRDEELREEDHMNAASGALPTLSIAVSVLLPSSAMCGDQREGPTVVAGAPVAPQIDVVIEDHSGGEEETDAAGVVPAAQSCEVSPIRPLSPSPERPLHLPVVASTTSRSLPLPTDAASSTATHGSESESRRSSDASQSGDGGKSAASSPSHVAASDCPIDCGAADRDVVAEVNVLAGVAAVDDRGGASSVIVSPHDAAFVSSLARLVPLFGASQPQEECDAVQRDRERRGDPTPTRGESGPMVATTAAEPRAPLSFTSPRRLPNFVHQTPAAVGVLVLTSASSSLEGQHPYAPHDQQEGEDIRRNPVGESSSSSPKLTRRCGEEDDDVVEGPTTPPLLILQTEPHRIQDEEETTTRTLFHPEEAGIQQPPQTFILPSSTSIAQNVEKHGNSSQSVKGRSGSAAAPAAAAAANPFLSRSPPSSCPGETSSNSVVVTARAVRAADGDPRRCVVTVSTLRAQLLSMGVAAASDPALRKVDLMQLFGTVSLTTAASPPMCSAVNGDESVDHADDQSRRIGEKRSRSGAASQAIRSPPIRAPSIATLVGPSAALTSAAANEKSAASTPPYRTLSPVPMEASQASSEGGTTKCTIRQIRDELARRGVDIPKHARTKHDLMQLLSATSSAEPGVSV